MVQTVEHQTRDQEIEGSTPVQAPLHSNIGQFICTIVLIHSEP